MLGPGFYNPESRQGHGTLLEHSTGFTNTQADVSEQNSVLLS